MSNKVAVVTGGQGSMAMAIAEGLNGLGIKVFNPEKCILDVTNELMIKEYMKQYKPWLLVNCAGYIVPNLVRDVSLKEWEEHFAVNVTGAFLCAKYACLEGCKIVINIGSTSAFGGRKEWGAYSASKVALLSLTETLVEEGIDAYTLNPARTASKMRERLFPGEDVGTLMNPKRVSDYVIKIVKGGVKPGSHLILSKDLIYILPGRSCPK